MSINYSDKKKILRKKFSFVSFLFLREKKILDNEILKGKWENEKAYIYPWKHFKQIRMSL